MTKWRTLYPASEVLTRVHQVAEELVGYLQAARLLAAATAGKLGDSPEPMDAQQAAADAGTTGMAEPRNTVSVGARLRSLTDMHRTVLL